MQKYPIGIQDFGELRDGGYVYIDKTQYIYNLITRGKPYFLSRPRRFGKSLLVSTLEEVFRGSKALFKGTFIYDKWDWEQTNPVIRISFAKLNYRDLGLPQVIAKELIAIATEYNIEITSDNHVQIFDELIAKINKKFGKVAILIDEYDKPIIDYIGEDDDTAKQNRVTLKSFYSILKDADAKIRFLFITGISKFTKVSIFSDLNHLNDISIDINYGAICGINEDELQSYFKQELIDVDHETLKEWYNGYTWDRKIKVYNPFSILNFFSKREFNNFWYQSGNPSFLWKLLKKVNVYDIENIESDLLGLESYEIENLNYKTLLYQTGYITFSEEIEPGYYKMRFPNFEVEDSFNKYLWQSYREDVSQYSTGVMSRLKKAFKDKDFLVMKEQLNVLFTSLPYDFMSKEKEVIFHAIVHLTFTLLDNFVVSEVHTHKGRCDALVVTDDALFCFEFKLGKSAKEALTQIKDKGYLNAYKHQGKELYMVGVNYSKTTREIDDFEWEQLV